MRRRLALPLLLLPGVGYLALFFGLPLALALLSSFGVGTIGVESSFTLGHYRELFANSIYRDGLVFSIYISIVPTTVSLLVSVPLAVALQASFRESGSSRSSTRRRSSSPRSSPPSSS